jgi:4-amino-4-deoxy-L-arabinose transferase-like glycosyltransferase
MRRPLCADLARATGLAVLAVVAGLGGLGSLASHHGDETAYIDAAVRMTETGHYLVPVVHDELLLDKPPLYYWLVALSFRILGVSLFAARLPSLLGVGLLAAIVYWFTARAYGSVRGAVYAALAMMSCIVTAWIGRLAVPDTVMTVGVLLGVAGYYRATTSTARARNLLIASCGVGIAGMAKGHVGVVVAVLPLVVMTILVDRGAPGALGWRDLAAPWTWLPAVVLCGWWYAYLLGSHRAVIEFAPAHPDAHETLGAALVAFLRHEVEHQVAPGWWAAFSSNLHKYGNGLVVWFFPWSLCIVAGLFIRPRPFWQDWKEEHRLTAILLTFIASILLLFTAIVLERSSVRYVLPIAPAVGILAGRYFVRREAARNRRGLLTVPVVVSAVLLVFYEALFGVFLPEAVRPPVDTLCTVLKPRLGPGDIILSAGLDDKWLTFATTLLNRPVESVGQSKATHDLEERIDRRLGTAASVAGGSVYLLTTAEAARALQERAPHRFQLLDRGAPGWAAERWELWERFALMAVRRDQGGGAD